MKDKVVVIKCPCWTYSTKEIAEQFNYVHQFLQKQGYNWDFVLIPRDWEWTEMSYDELAHTRDMLNRILESKDNDINTETRTRTETSSQEI